MSTALNSAGTVDHPGLLTYGAVSAHNWDVQTIWKACGDHVKGELRSHGRIGVYY
jgi:hypothetical protein